MESNENELNPEVAVSVWMESDEGMWDCNEILSTSDGDVEGNCDTKSIEETDDGDTFEMESDENELNPEVEVRVWMEGEEAMWDCDETLST